MKRLVCISDTHQYHSHINIPEGDFFLFAGDACNYGYASELHEFFKWGKDLPHEYKIFVPGNHDLPFLEDLREESHQWAQNAGFIVLEHEEVKIGGLSIFGSPWTPRFDEGWGWNYDKEEAPELWAQIPEYLDILITHGPPFQIRDVIYEGLQAKSQGCEDLLLALNKLVFPPRLHIFGHIHQDRGIKYPPYDPDLSQTLYANVSSKCRGKRRGLRGYQDPIVFDFDPESQEVPTIIGDPSTK